MARLYLQLVDYVEKEDDQFAGLSLPRKIDQPVMVRHAEHTLGLKLIGHETASLIGLACTFTYSAQTVASSERYHCYHCTHESSSRVQYGKRQAVRDDKDRMPMRRVGIKEHPALRREQSIS